MSPLVNCCLKSDKHSVHCKLCCKDFKINRVEISHINAHAKGEAQRTKGQRTFTISSKLSLSKSLASLKNIHTLKITLNLETVHTPFLDNFFLYIGFSWPPPLKDEFFSEPKRNFLLIPRKVFEFSIRNYKTLLQAENI